MPKREYVARVRVTCYVDGVRTEVQPGEPVPELSDHDTEQLLRMEAIADPAADASDERKAARAKRQADAEYQAQRAAVLAADESLSHGAPAAEAPKA